jgi:hypothetical protein
LRAARQQLLARRSIQPERIGGGFVRLAGGSPIGPTGEQAQQRLDEAVIRGNRGDRESK